ncbi:Hypothetical protein CAP_4816 [Chondromyces apiculatus DSM 436]|uniref:YkgJ family cysteine cluster protein n=2 Tax=Chondromyces apiculatus TaxID=51 RepID=A0A017T4F6_9BACT|nr:Hypothetical protein CAP_4816 [Chondromyces apiculatus DSM 436]
MAKRSIPMRLALLESTGTPLADASTPACQGCTALCCHDLAWPIARPTTPAEIDETRWRLHFDTVKIFIRGDAWYMITEGRCIYLGEDSRCTIYERRPQQCRTHGPPYCQRYIRLDDVEITTPEELEAHLARR